MASDGPDMYRMASLKGAGGQKKSRTKDRNAEKFWSGYAEALEVCKIKAFNDHWGKRRICQELVERQSSASGIGESRVGFYLTKFFYDLEGQVLFSKSCKAHVPHRRCVQ